MHAGLSRFPLSPRHVSIQKLQQIPQPQPRPGFQGHRRVSPESLAPAMGTPTTWQRAPSRGQSLTKRSRQALKMRSPSNEPNYGGKSPQTLSRCVTRFTSTGQSESRWLFSRQAGCTLDLTLWQLRVLRPPGCSPLEWNWWLAEHGRVLS